jgi:DNA-binding MarR family transcriptional regulator
MIEKNELAPNEKLLLYGLIKYPNVADKHLSEKLNVKHSTVTSIRHRLQENNYFKTLTIPRLQNLGCKMLVVIYTNFSPLYPLHERVKITGRTIEVFDEIFFSIGEQDKGFSLSLSKDYGTIGKINDIRTQTFGEHGLLEDKYPFMIVFPYEISKIYRFFDYAPLLKNNFSIALQSEETPPIHSTFHGDEHTFSDTEKNTYCMLVKHPGLSDREIGEKLGLSRHTISRLRRDFQQNNLIKNINLPDLKKLGFEILTFIHIRFDPKNPPNMEKDEAKSLMSDSTILMASRMFEAFLLSVHVDYDDYQKDRTHIMQVLKENNWIAESPVFRTHSLSELIYIKDFKFAPIARKILGCTLEV